MTEVIAESANDATFINLTSMDNKSFAISLEAAKKSQVIKDMLEVSTADPLNETVNVPLSNVHSKVLQMVIAYLENHKTDIIDLAAYHEQLVKNEVSDFDKNLLDTDMDTVSNVFITADFIDIAPLRDLCAWTMAKQIMKCKTPVDVRTAFNEVIDFSAEENAENAEEYKWYP